jgi:outer membrane protein insertion porin family
MFTFYDVGNVVAEDQNLNVKDFRSSVGLGLSWVSPMGPLRFAWARPVRKFEGDRIQQVQFQIGTSF